MQVKLTKPPTPNHKLLRLLKEMNLANSRKDGKYKWSLGYPMRTMMGGA